MVPVNRTIIGGHMRPPLGATHAWTLLLLQRTTA
jgi:hypothetical protein